MKRCKDKACITWKTLDDINHALKSDLTVVNGLELTVRQTWFKTGCKEEIEPIIVVINKLRWRLKDRIEQTNDIATENS